MELISEDEVELKGRLEGDLLEDMTLPVQEIEDNHDHFDSDDFVPTGYVLPRRRRVARCAVSMQPPPQVQSTSGSDLSCTIELCALRVYTEYAYGAAGSRLEPLSASTAVAPCGGGSGDGRSRN
jgi:hypothetical protein